jgi:hypothetical protein
LSENPAIVDVPAILLEIIARIGFPDVRGEWAAGLVGLIIGVGETELEVVVPFRVGTEGGIVLERGDVDWGTLERVII